MFRRPELPRLPSSLGLIESTDGAQTRDTVSLLGDADQHPPRIFAHHGAPEAPRC